MRWFVEISSLGKKTASGTTLCVEATQWQPALQRARALRGDEGPLSNFSIELLDDGYRAIDPSARLKYVVKRAPDDAALTNGEAVEQARALGSSPPSAGAKPVSPTASGKSERPPEPKKADAKKEEAPTPKKESAPPKAAEAAPQKTAAPRPESVKPPPVESVAAKVIIAIPDDKPPPPPARPGLPRYTVQSKREQPPTARSPLNYREYVFVVPEGTGEDLAEQLIRERFADVKKSLATIRAGKLVNLAVFDHAYAEKPKRPPLVTLAWKDWRGDDPEVRVPSREPGETPTPLAYAAPVAPVLSKPTPAPAPVAPSPAPVAPSPAPIARSPLPVAPSPAPVAAAPPAPPPPAPPPPAPPPPAPIAEVVAEPIVASPVVEITAAPIIAVEAAPPTPAVVEATPPAPPPPEEDVVVDEEEAPPSADAKTNGAASEPPPTPLPGPKTIIEAPRIELMEEPPPASFPTPSIVPPTPSYVPPAPIQPRASQPAPPPVPASAKKKRLAGDDLLSELFEALSELGFMHDALAGAEYVLAVALEKIPSEAGLVSFFDINKREFVVARQMGGETSVLGYRQPEKAPLAIEAMRSKHAVVVTDTEAVAKATDERWKNVGIEPKSLICAPIALGGRYLGLIEIVNPTDEGTYREGDGNALTYVGQQFGEFVAERGVIIDAEQILESAKASAAVLGAKRR